MHELYDSVLHETCCVYCSVQEELCDAVLQAYIQQLVEEQERDLVAIYVSKLPPALQSAAYAKFLEGQSHCDGHSNFTGKL